jgi:uncharacterized protein YbjT (DUF2867 family)
VKNIACVLGASGLIGGHLIDSLNEVDSFDEIILLTRKPMTSTLKVINKVINFDELKSELTDFKCHHLYICFGTTIKKAKTKKKFEQIDLEIPYTVAKILSVNGCQKISIVSSLGASSISNSFYLRIKGKLEDKLIALGVSKLNIFRPSVLVGERSERRYLEEISIKVGNIILTRIPYFNKYKPIKAKTVAKAMSCQRMEGKKVDIFEPRDIRRIANEIRSKA